MRDRLKSFECSKYLRAVADPERLKIIQCLQAGDRTVGDVARELNTSVANVSHHLKQLRAAGLVRPRRQGRFIHYALASEILRQPPQVGGSPLPVLDFGCCRLELGEKKGEDKRSKEENVKT